MQPNLPRQLEINISDNIFDLSIKIRAVEGLLWTFRRLGIINDEEAFYTYVAMQRKMISNMKVD